jgi:hypothetical protein
MSIKVVKKIVKKVEVEQKAKKEKKMTRRSLIEDKIKFLEEQRDSKTNALTPKGEEDLAKLKADLVLSKRGRGSKNKGASYERVIAQVFKEGYDLDLVRTPQSGGFAKKSNKADEFRGDIITVDKDIELLLHIECKDQKTWNLKDWLRQANEDCPKGKVPLVIMKKANTLNPGQKGNQQNLVVIDLDDFMKLVPKDKIVRKKVL